MTGSSTVHGPEFQRGDWMYTAAVYIPDGYDVHGDFDRFLIEREPVADPGRTDTRFEFYIPHRHVGVWGNGDSVSDIWKPGGVRRYADVFAAAESLVDFDLAWDDHPDLPAKRRAHLRECHDKGWSVIYSPLDLEYTAAYGEAKRLFTQFARTPEHLEQWRAEAGPAIDMGPSGAVLLAFPDGAPQAGPEPDGRPYWTGVEPEMGEGLPYGWPR
jgi:hypothetical protein